VPACHWTDGTSVDLRAVGTAARRLGAALVVDGTQSVGAVPFDVGQVEPDFLVVAGYKWLLGPYSLGLMWVHPRHRSGTPIEHGWPQRAGSDDFAGLVDYVDAYRPGARRYDVGENANFVLVPMALAALDQLLAWGVDRIAATCAVLTDAVADAADELGLLVTPPAARSPHLIGLTLPVGSDPTQVSAELQDSSVHVSVRGTSIRVSPHVYNDLDDVARFADALGRTLAAA
jgi:selenocysteine lyase/cysteine desulfurase